MRWKGWGTRPTEHFHFLITEAHRASVRGSHPLKGAKGGAPSVVVISARKGWATRPAIHNPFFMVSRLALPGEGEGSVHNRSGQTRIVE
jgi:hypothetical protein